jgi:hypothetical protein
MVLGYDDLLDPAARRRYLVVALCSFQVSQIISIIDYYLDSRPWTTRHAMHVPIPPHDRVPAVERVDPVKTGRPVTRQMR